MNKAPYKDSTIILKCHELAIWEENKGAHFLVNFQAREIWIHRPSPGRCTVRISLIRLDENGTALFDSPNFSLTTEEGRALWNDHVAQGAKHLPTVSSKNSYDKETMKEYEEITANDALEA